MSNNHSKRKHQCKMTERNSKNDIACFDCLRSFNCKRFERYQQNNRVNKVLRKAHQEYRREIKILLLGTGDSGKSTVMKQMKLLNGESLVNDDNIDSVKFLVYKNILRSFCVLIDARQKLGFPWSNRANEKFSEFLMTADTKQQIFTAYFQRFQIHMRSIWNDEAIQATFLRKNLFYISDGFNYFMENFDRISSKNYVPTNDDVLRCREATRVISEYSVNYKSVIFKFIDVGGQQSQRRKWFHVMDSVKSILFIVSSIEYDLHLVENPRKNRLEDSIEAFQNLVTNPLFLDGFAYIIFFNKTDMLESKLEEIMNNRRRNIPDKEFANTIDQYFDDFKGNSTSIVDVQAYLQNRFQQIFTQSREISEKNHIKFSKNQDNKNTSSQDERTGSMLFCHQTIAVDTKNMKNVFNAVRKVILNRNIELIMMA